METRQNVVVTGGAGFIGSEVVRQLMKTYPKIIIADNLSTGRIENLDGVTGGKVRFEKVDIRDGNRMRKLMQGAGVVFHLAALGLRHSLHSPDENQDVNAAGTFKLLSVARECAVKRFVHVSTSEVYGSALKKPIPETHPAFPSTVYGASKLAAESYARSFFLTYGFSAVIVRPFNTYGPRCHHEGDKGEVIPRFMLRCLAGRPMVIFGDGTQTRDFTFVSDIARGIIAAAHSEEAVGRTINLGSGSEISINELARKVAEAAGRLQAEARHVRSRPGDVMSLVADGSLARALLGFQAEVSLDEGLSRLRAWYQSLDTTPEQLLDEEIEINWERNERTADG